jgi:hypothetical protein
VGWNAFLAVQTIFKQRLVVAGGGMVACCPRTDEIDGRDISSFLFFSPSSPDISM